MTPYYEDNSVIIYHALAEEVIDGILNDLSGGICVLVTDPPYGIQGGRGGDAKDRRKADYQTDKWEDSPSYVADTIVPIVSKCLSVCVRAAVTPGNRNIFKYPNPADIGCFWTPAALSHGPWGFVTFNPILYYGSDHRAGHGAWPSGRQMTERPQTNKHPCAKPLEAWQWLVAKMVSSDNDVVLDPFVGSGTTLRAAKNLGVKSIGIDIDERYCEVAVKSIRQHVLPIDLLPYSPSKEVMLF